jgi:hypothetical protein
MCDGLLTFIILCEKPAFIHVFTLLLEFIFYIWLFTDFFFIFDFKQWENNMPGYVLCINWDLYQFRFMDLPVDIFTKFGKFWVIFLNIYFIPLFLPFLLRLYFLYVRMVHITSQVTENIFITQSFILDSQD